MNEPVLTKGERTRQELLEVAFALFTSQGFHGTSMRQIADQAGITVGSIYNHFTGKDDIFLAVAEAYHPLTKIAPLLGEIEAETVEELVKKLAREVLTTLDETPGLLKLALIEFVELEGRHVPAILNRFQPYIVRFVGRLAAAENQLRPVALPTLFRAFIGTVLAYKLTTDVITILPPDLVTTSNIDEFIDIFLHGILKEG